MKMFYCVGVPWGPGGNSEKTRILAIDACLVDHQSNRMGSHSKKLVLTPIFSAYLIIFSPAPTQFQPMHDHNPHCAGNWRRGGFNVQLTEFHLLLTCHGL